MKWERAGVIIQYVMFLGIIALLIVMKSSIIIWMILAFALFYPLLSFVGNFYVRNRLDGKIFIGTTAAKGTACAGAVLLKNNSWLPAVKMYCRVGIINDLTQQEENVEFVMGVGPKREGRKEFLLQSNHCGRLYVYIRSLKIMDYLGLFSLNVPLKAGARLTILPELFPCDVSFHENSAAMDEGSVSRRGDDRTETFQLREYQSGDDIRQIHWKLSSKLDTLILREPSQPVSRSLLVFWDKRNLSTPDKMTALAETTASVSQALCEKGIPFELCWTEKDELIFRQIGDSDTMLQVIPALVTETGNKECSLPEFHDYGRVLYISSAVSDEIKENHIFSLICGEEEYEEDGIRMFTSSDYQKSLERLEIG